MAIIACRECGRRVSDQAQTCPHCGYPLKQGVVEADSILTERDSKPRPQHIPKSRSFVGVLFLSLITLSVYYWLYLFGAVRDMENTLPFDNDGVTPESARKRLIASLLLFIGSLVLSLLGTLLLVATGVAELARSMANEGVLTPALTLYVMCILIVGIMSVFGFILTWKPLTGLLNTAHRNMNIEFASLGAARFWIVVGFLSHAISAVASVPQFLAFGSNLPPGAIFFNAFIALAWLIAILVLLHITVNSVNRLWEEVARKET